MFYFIFQKKFKANNAARVAHKFLNSKGKFEKLFTKIAGVHQLRLHSLVRKG